jgi:NTP pyrophosphatase (non-canonical NTP hydrolase)
MAGDIKMELVDDGFSIYQEKAMETAIYPEQYKIMYPALGLGEAGEVQNKVKKIYRDNGGQWSPENRIAVAEELGDLLWYIAVLANDLGVSLGYVATKNLDKLADRKERNVLGGSGDSR